MGSTILALVAVVCGAAALYFWTTLAKLQEQVQKISDRAEKAEGEERKAQERAEAMRKKLEKTAEAVAKEDRGQKDTAQRVASIKEDVAKARSGQKKAEDALVELQTKHRKAEHQLEELQLVVNELKGRKKAAVVVEEEAPAPPPPPFVEDPKVAARRAEYEAERALRQVELDKLRLEQAAVREEQQIGRVRDQLNKLRGEREWIINELFEMRLALRVTNQKAEDNRRAYIMTMGALDLAEDELYRLKHGRERPEFTPNRAAHVTAAVEVEGSDAGEGADVSAALAETEAESATTTED
jgi:chromosome segregation ATPase